jgi:hypothetical protein
MQGTALCPLSFRNFRYTMWRDHLIQGARCSAPRRYQTRTWCESSHGRRNGRKREMSLTVRIARRKACFHSHLRPTVENKLSVPWKDSQPFFKPNITYDGRPWVMRWKRPRTRGFRTASFAAGGGGFFLGSCVGKNDLVDACYLDVARLVCRGVLQGSAPDAIRCQHTSLLRFQKPWTDNIFSVCPND